MTLFHFSAEALSASAGDIFYIHDNELSQSGAYELSESIGIKLMIPRSLGTDAIRMDLYRDSEGNTVWQSIGKWSGIEGIYDVYTFDIGKLDVPSLYWFCFELNSVFGRIYAHRDGNRVTFTSNRNSLIPFQLTASEFAYSVPAGLAGGVIYHIFVDRFARGGKVDVKPDARIVDDWSIGVAEYPAYPGAPMKNNTFYGGTIWGIIDKIDYIASLGVNIIYLSPIFDATSNHKYDTADYMHVDQMFGGDEALKALIREAKARGIQIVLDGVFNHTGDDSIYFDRYGKYGNTGAATSKSSKYFEWYDFQSYPDKYTCWWGIDILPRINTNVPSCRDYFVGDGGVIEKYAKMGVAGFRLDVVDELSDEFIKKLKSRLNDFNCGSVLYGEVWEDASNKMAYDVRKQYYLGKELDGVMNYPLRSGIIDYVKHGNTDKLKYALTEVTFNAPKRIRDVQMNLLGTHDTERILTVLGGKTSEGIPNDVLRTKRMSEMERSKAKLKLKSAYTILATLPGIPTVFYGDEAGLEGYHDPFNRMPYPWGNEEQELLEHYRCIGALRRNNNVYSDGEFKLIHLDPRLLIFARYQNDNAYVTVYNNSEKVFEIMPSRNTDVVLGANDSKLSPKSAKVFKTKVGTTFVLNEH